MVPVVNVYTNSKDLDDITISFEMKIKTLKGKLPNAFELLDEILFTSCLTDIKRLQEILGELKSRMQSNMISAGHHVAAGRAASYFSKSAAIQDALTGLPAYRLIERIEGDMDAYADELIAGLTGICKYLFTQENLMFDFTGEEAEYEQFCKLAEAFAGKLPNEGAVAYGIPVHPQIHCPADKCRRIPLFLNVQ